MSESIKSVSYKMEVFTTSWNGNGCRYATKDEAIGAGRELLSRWMLPTDYRTVLCDDEVNYKFEDRNNVSL